MLLVDIHFQELVLRKSSYYVTFCLRFSVFLVTFISEDIIVPIMDFFKHLHVSLSVETQETICFWFLLLLNLFYSS